MKKRVFWFEDEAGFNGNANQYAGPVYATGKYTMKIVTELSEAQMLLIPDIDTNQYHIVVIDIRINSAHTLQPRRLGLTLLADLLGASASQQTKDYYQNRVGVFTVEEKNTLIQELRKLEVCIPESYVVEKSSGTDDLPEIGLVNLIMDIDKGLSN